MPRRRLIPTDPAEQGEEDLRSRTDARYERLAREDGLMELSTALVELAPAALGRLELPEEALRTIEEVRRIPRGSARNRAVRLVRAALRGVDAEALARALARVHRPGRKQAPPG